MPDTKRINIKKVGTPFDLDPEIKEMLDEMDHQALEVRYQPKDKAFWWIAYDDDKPIGYAGMTIHPTWKCMELVRAAVIHEYRGLGLQRRLIYARERQARKENIFRSVTYTSCDNFVSANNLIKCGYRLYKPVNKFGVANALYFEKKL